MSAGSLESSKSGNNKRIINLSLVKSKQKGSKSMKEATGLKIMRRCSRFERCDVPICPLDLNQDHRTSLTGEKRCTLAKSYRLRIGKMAGLPRNGLTRREHASRIQWDGLKESEKRSRMSHLRPFGKLIHAVQKSIGK